MPPKVKTEGATGGGDDDGDNNGDIVVNQGGPVKSWRAPRFAGDIDRDKEVSLEASLFLQKFSTWAQCAGLDDADKAKSLSFSLTRNADQWYKQIQRRDQIDLNDWVAVEAAFRSRFIKPLSPTFIQTEMSKLRQRSDETVESFLDRVELAQSLMDEQWRVAVGAANRPTRLEVVNDIHDKMVLFFFLNYMRPELRKKLSSCNGLTTLRQHVDAAAQFERDESSAKLQAKSHQAPPTSFPPSNPVSSMDLDAMDSQKKKSVPKGDYRCNICGVPGHYISDCKKKQKGSNRRSPSNRSPTQQQSTQGNVVPINKARTKVKANLLNVNGGQCRLWINSSLIQATNSSSFRSRSNPCNPRSSSSFHQPTWVTHQPPCPTSRLYNRMSSTRGLNFTPLRVFTKLPR